MKMRRIGELEVSVVGLGCNNFGSRIDIDQARTVVDAAIDVGVNYFDTAELYGAGQSEEFLGAALAGRRDTVHIATKWGMGVADFAPRPGTRPAVRAALEASLKRLGTDYVDHYQLHQPDPDTDIAETLQALTELKDEGKILEIGCSNFSAEQLDESVAAASAHSTASFVSVQNHYSLLTREPEKNGVLDACARHSIGFVPFFPLESGLLTGKYEAGKAPAEGTRMAAWGDRASRFLNDEHMATVEVLDAWATARDHTILELAMSWLASNELVASVIAGATKPEQVRANVAGAGWAITNEERAELAELLEP